MLKSLHLNFIYIPTICFVVEVSLIFSTHTLLFPLNLTLCTCQLAVSLRQNSVTLIRFGLQKFNFYKSVLPSCYTCSVLFHIDSHCEPRIPSLLERKSEEATIAGHPLGVGSLWLSTYFFFRNFATYCSSLLGLRSNIFLVIYFSLSCTHLRLHTNDTQISSPCFHIQHESSEESIKKGNKKCKEKHSG